MADLVIDLNVGDVLSYADIANLNEAKRIFSDQLATARAEGRNEGLEEAANRVDQYAMVQSDQPTEAPYIATIIRALKTPAPGDAT